MYTLKMRKYAKIPIIIAIFIFMPFIVSFLLYTISLLGFIGLSLDFSGYGDTAGINFFLLPFTFIAFVVYIINILLKRRSNRKYKELNQSIKQKVLKEQNLGSSNDEVIISLLSINNGMTADELAIKLNLPEEQVLLLIRDLLKEGYIYQDVKQSPAVYFAYNNQRK